MFLRRPHEVLSRQVIGQHLWGVDFAAESTVIAVYVRRLRRKLAAGGRRPAAADPHRARGGLRPARPAVRPLASVTPGRGPADGSGASGAGTGRAMALALAPVRTRRYGSGRRWP